MKIKLIFILLFYITVNFLFSDSIQLSADYMQYEAAEGSEYTLLSGNAYVQTGSKEITADEIRLYGEDYNILVCNGNVEVQDSEEDFKINSQFLYYDRKSKITKINSRSIMEDYKNEMIIKSGFMEYKENDNSLILQIGVRILKENLTCRCEFATYDKNLDTLIMTGLPVVYKENDSFEASKIKVLLETDEIIMSGKVEGSLKIDDEENPGLNEEESNPEISEEEINNDRISE